MAALAFGSAPLSSLAAASPGLPLADLIVPAGTSRAYVQTALAIAGNVTVAAGATLSLDATLLSFSSPGSSITLQNGARLLLLNGSRVTSVPSSPPAYSVNLTSGSTLAADHASIERFASFDAADSSISLNLTRLADGAGPVLLGGASRLLATNSSFVNISGVALDLRDASAADVRGLGAPPHATGPSARFAYSNFAAVIVSDASGKALAGVDWSLSSGGSVVAASPGFGGDAPFTQLDHQGYASPLWQPVVALVDEGANRTSPPAFAAARYGSWSDSKAVDTSVVAAVAFTARPEGVSLALAPAAETPDGGRGWMAGDPAQSQGPGAAWGDFNGDGKVDVIVTAAPEADAAALAARGMAPEDAPAPTLFLGRGDGTFLRAERSGLESARGATGVASADFDSDGSLDLFVARYGTAGTLSANASTGAVELAEGRPLGGLLFRNAHAAFEDVTAASGLRVGGRHTVGGAWGDYNGDGCIDLYVLNMGEILRPPQVPGGGGASGFGDNFIRNESNALWKNNCDGTFSEVTASAGGVTGGGEPGAVGLLQSLVRVPEEQYFVGNRSGLSAAGSGISYAALWLDVDGDGRLDLLVADDFGASPLYRNNGDGTFAVWTQQAGMLRVGSAMGFAAADFDRDGDLDLFQTNFNRDFLWINDGHGGFAEEAEAWGAADMAVGWGVEAPDLNLDGFPDLAIATGAMSLNLKASERSVLYLNEGGTRFVDVAAASGFDGPGAAISITQADADGDGRADLLVGRLNGANALFLNRQSGGGFVRIDLRGVLSPTLGEGAQVSGVVGGRPFRAAIAPSGGYASSSEAAVTIGLGAAPRAEAVTVWWPSGAVQRLGDLDAGARVTVREATSIRAHAGEDRTLVIGDNVTFTGWAEGRLVPGGSYRWTVEGDGAPRQIAGRELTFVAKARGLFIVNFEVLDRFGEVLAADAALIRVVETPRPDTSAPKWPAAPFPPAPPQADSDPAAVAFAALFLGGLVAAGFIGLPARHARAKPTLPPAGPRRRAPARAARKERR